VPYRSGWNTITGTEAGAKATQNGYTILLASSTLLTTPSLIPKMPCKVLKDFTGGHDRDLALRAGHAADEIRRTTGRSSLPGTRGARATSPMHPRA